MKLDPKLFSCVSDRCDQIIDLKKIAVNFTTTVAVPSLFPRV